MNDIEPRLGAVREMIKVGGFNLYHFVCHGSFDPNSKDLCELHLADEDRLKPRDITGLRAHFGKDFPFIFINACQTARADFSLVGIGGWASTFIHAKASGFLGSAWEVDDE